MTEDRKLTFAPFVAAACVLWIIATATGSQGFTAIIGVLAIASLFFARPKLNFPAYGWVLIAFLAWITTTSLWSPVGGDWISGTLTGEDFAVEVASIRLIGVAVFSALAICAAARIPNGAADKSSSAILLTIAAMAGILCLVLIFRDAILEMAYPGDPLKAQKDGVQNLGRAANSVAVIVPLGLAIAWHKFYSAPARGALIGAMIIILVVFQLLGSQSAVFSCLLMIAAFAGLRWFHTGIKALLRLIAVYALFAPVIMLAVTQTIGALGLKLPASFQTRVFCWQETLSKIAQKPFIGHGLEASGTWNDTYVAGSTQLKTLTALAAEGEASMMELAWQDYPIIPGHPHNMALELWAETGFIGAILFASVLWMLGGSNAIIRPMRKDISYASVGLIAAALPLFSFAYSAWNEAYWAMLAIALCVIMVLSKRAPS